MMSVFTDCPGREKLSYPADYTMPMGAIHRNYDLDAYLRTTMRHLVEGQSMADTPMFGNVALKTPVYDWGYTGRFGDEINWGNAIILVPALLYELYGDTQTMARYYDRMVDFADYIQRQKVGTGADAAHRRRGPRRLGRRRPDLGPDHRHLGLLHHDQQAGDDGAADRAPGRRRRSTGRSPGHQGRVQRPLLQHARCAGTPPTATPAPPARRRPRRRSPSTPASCRRPNGRPSSTRSSNWSTPSTRPATVRTSAAAPSAWRRPSGRCRRRPRRRAVGPAAGGRAAQLRVLHGADHRQPGRDDHHGGAWNRGDSKNHMILAQIEEWFHTGLAGIREGEGSIAYRTLVIQPIPSAFPPSSPPPPPPPPAGPEQPRRPGARSSSASTVPAPLPRHVAHARPSLPPHRGVSVRQRSQRTTGQLRAAVLSGAGAFNSSTRSSGARSSHPLHPVHGRRRWLTIGALAIGPMVSPTTWW